MCKGCVENDETTRCISLFPPAAQQTIVKDTGENGDIFRLKVREKHS